MEMLRTEYCDVCDDYVRLDMRQGDCAFEHSCELPKAECPLLGYFVQPKKSAVRDSISPDYPKYYFADIE